MEKKILVIVATFIMVLSIGGYVANAEVAFSYKGWGIRSWPTQSRTTVNKTTTFTIKHSQKKYNKPNCSMTVYLQKKVWNDWINVASKNFSNNNGGSFSSKQGAGTYRLYFKTDKDGAFYVKGSLNK